jgi:hypothetical protein
MTVTKRHKRTGRALPYSQKWMPCHNQCRRNGSLIDATHIVWIIGRPTYLCHKCSTEWAAIYEGARCSA